MATSLQPGAFDTLLDALAENVQRSAVTRDRVALLLMHDSALRVHEAVQLDVRHVDLSRRTLVVHGKGSRWHAGKKVAKVPTTSRLDAAIVEHLEATGYSTGALLRTRTGSRVDPSHYRRMLAKVGWAVLHEHVHPHMLRHTRLTELYFRDELPLKFVQAMARHSSLATTDRYLHLPDDWMDVVYRMSLDQPQD